MIRIDGWVLAFTFGLSVITGVVFGLAPAFRATRHGARESLGQAARGVIGGRERLRSALTVSETALALILGTGAGLMLKSYLRLRAVKRAFSPHCVMPLTVDWPESE